MINLNKIKYIILLLPLFLGSLTAIGQTAAETGTGFSGINIGAGLAVGLAAIGAGMAVGMAAAAGIGVLTEKREMFGTVLIFVAIGEGIAVYGILFAVLMLFGKF
ncbi:MAG: V-type ATP synthase subunit K [Metallosphaera yellowstonensis]|jgi:V/A-type H+-transporting ATPase subunit K|uniref:ATP synthase subunit C n=1 Tax=Metallosphaera yellowstonensis MK1 TaxID=671065 RepID=H2C9F4_9CREN|nr:ATP synthase subunit K [Metallosphaera yellowstonensis]EHP68780.1 ATP synthase subunit C [Metallosphaera yellowstonensis MK1]